MHTANLFEIASLKAGWLAARQAAVASNIANANTPGYRALDVAPFAEVLSRIGAGAGDPAGDRGLSLSSTGEPVRIEDELVRSGEVRRDYELGAGIVGAFHSMLMLVSRT